METLFEKRLDRNPSLNFKKRLSLVTYEENTPISIVTNAKMEPEENYGLSDEMLIYQMMNRNLEGTLRPLKVINSYYK